MQMLVLLEKNETSGPEKPYIPIALQRIIDDINRNFASIRNVNDILTTHFISSATLTRWFRKYIHSSPREYLESVRLSNATKMLVNGSSVTEACMSSGFSDCSHFIALFKKRFGETPYSYKKQSMKK
jgi:AraC-like DNA-binding protein